MTLVLHKPVGFVSGQPDPGKVPAVRLLKTPNRVGEGETPARDASLPPSAAWTRIRAVFYCCRPTAWWPRP